MLTTTHILITLAFALVIFIGTVGNILVCLVILLNQSMRTPMNYLILNLAISDMLLLIFMAPTFVFRKAFTHPLGKAGDLLCIFITGETFAWMAGFTSAAILIAIAIERYYAVAKPHSYNSNFISKHLKLTIAGCWLFAFAWNCIGFKIKYYNEALDFCDMAWRDENSFKIYASLCFLVVSVIPSVSMSYLYSRAVYILWFKLKKVKINRTNSSQEKERLKRKRATRMALSVSIIYAVCWIPQSTIFVLAAHAPYLIKGSIAYPVTVAMVSLNSAINPLIYSFHSNQYRRTLQGWCKRARARRVGDSESGANTTDSRSNAVDSSTRD